MTDTDPNAELPPAAPIELDRHGDPIRQGTLMGERESYERVVDGLIIMAEAAAHMAQRDAKRREKLLQVAVRLDLVRVTAVQKAGISDKARQRETDLTPNPPMGWKAARTRFRFGAKQAQGGFSQLATCHRGELVWSTMAANVGRLADAVTKESVITPARRSLLLPPHLTQQ